MPLAQLFGVTQCSPGVIQRRLHGADQFFALRNTPGQRAGQCATRAMIAARQTFADKGVRLPVAHVQAVVDLLFVAMPAGDQQVSQKGSSRFGVAMIDSGSSRSRMA